MGDVAQEAPEPPDHRIIMNMIGILYGSREGVRPGRRQGRQITKMM